MLDMDTVVTSVSASAATMTRPALLFPSGNKPVWVDTTGLYVDPAQSIGYRPVHGQKLVAVSLHHTDVNGITRTGRRWFLGVRVTQHSLLSLPLANSFQSLINHSLAWVGSIPAPWGLAVWTHQVLVSTDLVTVSYIMEVPDVTVK